jgi:5-methylcytosine-specific restriction endonuclease McrA
MNIIKLIKTLIKEKNEHFLSVDSKTYNRYKYLIKFCLLFNKNYKICEIRRIKFKSLKNFVVVGLRYNGKNVKRRTGGFAKNFIETKKNAKCLYCGIKLNIGNATADHIIPISNGGNNTKVNLVVCCSSCNEERGNIEFIKFLKSKNNKIKNIKRFFV